MIFFFYAIAALLVIGLAYLVIWILREYERGVVFFLGRFQSVAGPGLVLMIPGIQQMVKIDLRTRVLDVPTQDVISRDNVSVKVNAVIYFRVIDPEKAVVQVEDFFAATSQLAQTTLRSASACLAMARIMLSLRSTCLISTAVTLMPQASDCASRMARMSALSLSRSASISSSSC